MLPTKTEILIVGAGPTGLALAVSLSQAGIDHVLIDALPEGQNTSRAAVIHASTLEALSRLGVAERLRAEGIELTRFTIRDRGRPLLRVEFDELPSQYQCLLMVPQSTTEAVLAARLAALGGSVHRNVKALTASRTAGRATVRVETPDGEQTIHARFVVGGDGMHSVVREAAGIGFDGAAYGESFVLADVRMDWPLGRDEVSLFFAPAGLTVVAPLPGGSFRIVATLDDAPQEPSVADIQRLLDTRGPAAGGTRVSEVIWGSRFRVHHRLAREYRNGPFLLMGDAAHVHSPAGGQGMNTGLIDAVLLGEVLTRIVRDGAPDTLTEQYGAARRQAAAQVLQLAGRLTRMALIRSRFGRVLRNLVLRSLDTVSRFRHRLAMNLSGLNRRALSELPVDSDTPAIGQEANIADLRKAA